MRDRVIEAVRNNCVFKDRMLTEETTWEEAGMDSLSFIGAIVELEDEFSVTFDDEELVIGEWINIGQLNNALEEKLNGA